MVPSSVLRYPVREFRFQGQVVLGKVVYAQNGNTVKLDLNVASGLYLIDVAHDGEHTRTKMTVQ